ncbi:MAG: hypothetical protein J2P21_30190 [Chloracidobacterium sp.]|nr:hypothetical protein [Chloracidobacterium sp.]
MSGRVNRVIRDQILSDALKAKAGRFLRHPAAYISLIAQLSAVAMVTVSTGPIVVKAVIAAVFKSISAILSVISAIFSPAGAVAVVPSPIISEGA